MSATANFSANNTDPKAQLLAELNFLNNGTVSLRSHLPSRSGTNLYIRVSSVRSCFTMGQSHRRVFSTSTWRFHRFCRLFKRGPFFRSYKIPHPMQPLVSGEFSWNFCMASSLQTLFSGRYNSVSLAQLTPSVIDAIVSDYNVSLVCFQFMSIALTVPFRIESHCGTVEGSPAFFLNLVRPGTLLKHHLHLQHIRDGVPTRSLACSASIQLGLRVDHFRWR